jgi:hypothetical protein
VDRDDVRVVQITGHHRLRQESLTVVLDVGAPRMEAFDGHPTVQGDLTSGEDFAHPALADPGFDLEQGWILDRSVTDADSAEQSAPASVSADIPDRCRCCGFRRWLRT